MRVVVTGMAATYPFGGVFWDYMQYALGFKQLGHDALYIEDTGKWCYDPVQTTFVEDGEKNAEHLARHIRQLDPDLADCWFFRDGRGSTFGRPWQQVVEFCGSADLFLHISASCLMRDEYLAAGTVAFIDSDPMYTQVGFLTAGNGDDHADGLAWWLQHHDAFFTFGENVGQPGCGVPTASIRWIPTRQPIVTDCFARSAVPARARRRAITTVASWEPSQQPLEHDGVSYAGKSAEFLRFMALPSRSPVPMEVAMSGPAPADLLEAAGWCIVDGYSVSHDPWVYREYLANSLAECSIAKNAYVAPRSGWFSCRSACYLALGVPVVVQDTGIGDTLPTGEGLFAFGTMDEAVAALDAVAADYDRHCKAARAIAEEYFDARKVLTRLLDDIGLA